MAEELGAKLEAVEEGKSALLASRCARAISDAKFPLPHPSTLLIHD